MSKELIDEKRQLYKDSRRLREIDLSNTSYDTIVEIRKLQDEKYKKWKFLKGYLNSKEKIENEKKN